MKERIFARESFEKQVKARECVSDKEKIKKNRTEVYLAKRAR